MIDFFTQYSGDYLAGLFVSVYISVASMVIALVLGTLGAIGRNAKSGWIRGIVSLYVTVFRALPPLLMLFLVYFGLPEAAVGVGVLETLFDPFNNRAFAAIAAFGITGGAYTTEIVRSGISSVGEEQLESAKSLGMSYPMMFRRVIAPQALKIAFPPLTNEYIQLLKATSLASVIGVVELLRQAQIVASSTFMSLEAYLMAGVYYVLLVIVIQILLTEVEERLPGPKPPRRRLIKDRILRRPVEGSGL